MIVTVELHSDELQNVYLQAESHEHERVEHLCFVDRVPGGPPPARAPRGIGKSMVW